MDPAQISQGAGNIPGTACVDAKRLRFSAMPDDPVSKVHDLEEDNTTPWKAGLAPLDDENLLQEILLRLPPQPSSLPRASLVCKRWCIILSDPQFHKRFRKHHQKPPLLGFFAGVTSVKHDFVPVLDTKPDCIATERFTVPKSSNPFDQDWDFLGCRHGLAVLLNECRHEVIVWDPLTGQQNHVPFPPGLLKVKRETFWFWHCAAMCTDTEDGHVHGDCFSSPFKLVLTWGGAQTFACLYESGSDVWGNIVSIVTRNKILAIRPNILIGNDLFWLLFGGGILAFDTKRHALSLIEKPVDAHHTDMFSFQLLRTDDSALGLAVLSKLSIQMWKRKSNCDGGVGWVPLQKIIQLEGLFPWEMHRGLKVVKIVGYDEDSNVFVLDTYIGDFMFDLESMQFRAISKSRNCWSCKIHCPYRNFYTAGRGVWWKGSGTVNK